MKLRYATTHKWIETITADPLSELGKNNKSRIRSTVKNLLSADIKHEIKPLDQSILDWFVPLYLERIGSKENPKVFDIYGTTLGKESKYKYFALILFEDGEPIGATIFSERKNLLSIAYRIFPNQWKNHSLQANPSLYTEYLLNQYGWERGYKKLSHGRDRNPYGLNSHIGLAIFKLSVGCKAFLPSVDCMVDEIDLDEINEDILILVYPEDGDQITNAILYVKDDNFYKYDQVTKYPNRLAVEVIYRQ